MLAASFVLFTNLLTFSIAMNYTAACIHCKKTAVGLNKPNMLRLSESAATPS